MTVTNVEDNVNSTDPEPIQSTRYWKIYCSTNWELWLIVVSAPDVRARPTVFTLNHSTFALSISRKAALLVLTLNHSTFAWSISGKAAPLVFTLNHSTFDWFVSASWANPFSVYLKQGAVNRLSVITKELYICDPNKFTTFLALPFAVSIFLKFFVRSNYDFRCSATRPQTLKSGLSLTAFRITWSRILSSAHCHLVFFHPHFVVLILSSSFYHSYFVILFLSPAFYHPHFPIRHPRPPCPQFTETQQLKWISEVQNLLLITRTPASYPCFVC